MAILGSVLSHGIAVNLPMRLHDFFRIMHSGELIRHFTIQTVRLGKCSSISPRMQKQRFYFPYSMPTSLAVRVMERNFEKNRHRFLDDSDHHQNTVQNSQSIKTNFLLFGRSIICPAPVTQSTQAFFFTLLSFKFLKTSGF